jgi:hypothetical protein
MRLSEDAPELSYWPENGGRLSPACAWVTSQIKMWGVQPGTLRPKVIGEPPRLAGTFHVILGKPILVWLAAAVNPCFQLQSHQP